MLDRLPRLISSVVTASVLSVSVIPLAGCFGGGSGDGGGSGGGRAGAGFGPRPYECATSDDCSEGTCVNCADNPNRVCTFSTQPAEFGYCQIAPLSGGCDVADDCNAFARDDCERFICYGGEICAPTQIPGSDGQCLLLGPGVQVPVDDPEAQADVICDAWAAECGSGPCPARDESLLGCDDAYLELLKCWVRNPPSCAVDPFANSCAADYIDNCPSARTVCWTSPETDGVCESECDDGADAFIASAACDASGCRCTGGPQQGRVLTADCETLGSAALDDCR